MTETLPTPWDVAARWQEYEGEVRANLLRVCGIGAFYLIELWNRGNVDPAFHRAVTALASGWVMVAWAVHMTLRRRAFPAWLKSVSTGLDLVFFTVLLLLADGPRSPLVYGYFFILVLSALRFSLPLVRWATVGAAASYLFVAGQALRRRPEVSVPRVHEALLLTALVLCGVALGQLLRRARALAEDYAARREAAR